MKLYELLNRCWLMIRKATDQREWIELRIRFHSR